MTSLHEALIIAGITIVAVPLTTLLTHLTKRKLKWVKINTARSKEGEYYFNPVKFGKNNFESVKDDAKLEAKYIVKEVLDHIGKGKNLDDIKLSTRSYLYSQTEARTRALRSEVYELTITDRKISVRMYIDSHSIVMVKIKIM